MDELKEQIINLCQHLFGETKKEVKENNKSVDELIAIFDRIKETPGCAKKIYGELLYHDDDRVCFEAAASCLKLNENVTQAKKVLKSISKNNSNPNMRFSAEMLLEVWKERGCLNF